LEKKLKALFFTFLNPQIMKFQKNTSWLLIAAFYLFLPKINAQHDHGTASTDKPSVHGMLIFGTDNVYASHLPMFHSPHNYQIILELTLDKTAKQKFVADQLKNPQFTTYTIEPERFVLPDMVAQKGSFKAHLYRGHFERGGVKIAENITLKISKVVYFKKFETAESKTENALFLLFGSPKEQFAVHQISNKPDFEQIIQVKADLKNAMETAVFSAKNTPIGISSNTIKVKIGQKETDIVLLKQLYLEFDDLKE
jgi:hypothetical protein